MFYATIYNPVRSQTRHEEQPKEMQATGSAERYTRMTTQDTHMLINISERQWSVLVRAKTGNDVKL